MLRKLLGRASELRLAVLLSLLGCALFILHLHRDHPDPDIENAKRSVVAIEGTRGLVGTGFFFTPQACFMTAAHIAEDFAGSTATVKIYGSVRDEFAEVHSIFPELDLAVMCLTSRKEVENWLYIRDSVGVRDGDRVYVVGHPQGYRWNVTEGVVSRFGYLNWPVDYKIGTLGSLRIWIPRYTMFVTAFILKGSSGSPVLDENGSAIGLITSFGPKGISHPTALNHATSGTDMRRYLKKYLR